MEERRRLEGRGPQGPEGLGLVAAFRGEGAAQLRSPPAVLRGGETGQKARGRGRAWVYSRVWEDTG